MLLLGIMLTILVVNFSIIEVQEKMRNTAISLHKACIVHGTRVKSLTHQLYQALWMQWMKLKSGWLAQQ